MVPPVDALLFREGTVPEEASRRVLIRRLSLDLLGLPPSPEQVEAFEKRIDPRTPRRALRTECWRAAILASAGRGTGWTSRGMPTATVTNRISIAGGLAYRDWVIRAFNDDLPSTRLSAGGLPATSWHRKSRCDVRHRIPGGCPCLRTRRPRTPRRTSWIRYDELDDMVSTTASAFLGLTLACARCHDHKFDPLPTRDYYRMVAAFSTSGTPRGVALQTPARMGGMEEQQRTACRESRMTALGLSEEQKFWLRQPEHFFVPVQTALYKEYGARLKVEDADLRQWLPESGRATWDALEAAAHRPEPDPNAPQRCLGVMDHQAEPMPQFLLGRGNVLNRKEPVTAGFLQVLDRGRVMSPIGRRSCPGGFGPPRDTAGGCQWIRPSTDHLSAECAGFLADGRRSGRRGADARVIVNRIWQHHFGEGLVRTPNDFGTQGDAPRIRNCLNGWPENWFASTGT